MTVQLALYIGKGNWFNALIRFWTSSPYSHCELVVDGMCYSSSQMDGGVRAKRIDLGSKHWELVPIPWADPQRILDYYDATRHQSYGYLDLLRSQFFNRAKDHKSSAFCSEWCAAALGLPNPTIYSPHTLGEFVRIYGR
jgi:hypothetical protein